MPLDPKEKGSRMTTSELLGQHLAVLRGEMTIDEASAESGLHKRTLIDLEAGHSNANLETLDKLARAYKCTLADLFQPWAVRGSKPETEILYKKVRAILEQDPEKGKSIQTVIDVVFKSLRR